jgi:glycosyltransferase involved in cell wall biosynthesis
MRVCFVSPVAELGGSEQSLLDVMVSLRGRGLDCTLISFADGELLEQARRAGVDSYIVALPGGLRQLGESGLRQGHGWPELLRSAAECAGFLAFAARFRRLLAQLRPDVLHTNGIKAHIVGAAFAPRSLPIAMHMRDYLSQRLIARHLLRALRRPSLHVITNSHSVAEDARRVLPNVSIEPIYNAIDTVLFSPGPAEPEWLAALAGEAAPAPGTLSVGLVATYANWKGQDLFIQAIARLVDLLPSVEIVAYVIGGPIYATPGSQFSRPELEALAREAGVAARIRFVPFQRQVERIYRSLDVVVHASTRPEAFGRTIAEAMACARPVVVSQAGGAAELFEDGTTAFGFRPGDASALANVLARVCSAPELRERVARVAREHAVSEFDRARLGEQVLEVYEMLLGFSEQKVQRVA